MKRSASFQTLSFAGLLLASAILAPAAFAGGGADDSNAATDRPQVATDYIMIKFQDPPAACYEGGLPGLARTKPLTGKFNRQSRAARAYFRHLGATHANYRSWLARNAAAAQIVREYRITFNGVAVKLNGVPPERAAAGPGVRAWAYSGLYHPTMNVSTSLIGADALWGGSPADAGRGISVAIIDSGIQDGHPFFACKHIRHHGPYFSGVAPVPPFSPFPVIFDTHGTHVAGTVGGCVSELAAVDPDGPITGSISGVAPGVTLHDFNVFPGIGAAFWTGFLKTGQVSAFSHDIAAAIEDAVALGVDVINMSLGGGVAGPHDFLAEVADAAVDAGVVVCASAGNNGPGDATVGSPGSGRKVIAAGMSSNPHFIGIPVTVGTVTYGAAVGEFTNFNVVTAPYTVTTPANGCTAIREDLTGKIALIDRGDCTFSTKIRNAQAAGAIGVLMVNNRPGDPFGMAQDGTPNQPTIPAAMLGRQEGNAIKPAGTVTVDGTTLQEFRTGNADILALDSSRGPAPFTFLVKPDVVAPGVNVYSSVFGFGPGGFSDVTYDFELFSGTSMAAPHVAGAAALLLAEHPDWSPADVRSALVNTAARTVTDPITGTADPGLLARGGGRIDVVAASTTPLTLDPATVSFGFWSGNQTVAASVQVRLRNVSGAPQSVTVAASGPPIVSVTPTLLTLAAGESASFTVKLDAGTSAQTGSGDYDGEVVVSTGGRTLRLPWFVRIDRRGKL
jgi:minor extracellular serine protease Vpr